eukprot:TRINITY_DN54748_c0_g1_i1.p1 TRINITY_DN54748_c0_g1~~TRINITY_DN54748_c0_g1_i1.p1  ORF type:complete len:1827 (-),score=255.23 TRINITY_DN54748_c0_g1_i1:83-5563(-)
MLCAEVLFPPACNWYVSHGVDALPDGTLVVATNQAVTVVDGATRQIVGICNLRGRVSGVAINDHFICACTADRFVHVLNKATLSSVTTHRDHTAEPTAIDVFVEGVDLGAHACGENTSDVNAFEGATVGARAGAAAISYCIISGDKRGCICFLSVPVPSAEGPTAVRRKVHRTCPLKEAVVCLAVGPSPKNTQGPPSRLAIGYAGGVAAVLDLSTRDTLSTLRHRAQVQSLSWAPDDGCYLASSCQDHSVQLWNVGDDGRKDDCEQISEFPDQSGRQEGRFWVSVFVASKKIVLYSGPRGEFFRWEAGKRKAHRAAPIHTRAIFCIRPVGDEHVITAGMDRLLVLWSLCNSAPQMKWRLCSIGGHVTAFRTDGANVAVLGCGDGSARVVDLMHREHRQHCWVAWRGLGSTITSLALGPSNNSTATSGGSIWAYGLQDGGFGLLPINTIDGPGTAEPVSCRSHTHAVTSLCWLRAPQTPPTVATSSSQEADGADASKQTAGDEVSSGGLPSADTRREAAADPRPKGRSKKSVAAKTATKKGGTGDGGGEGSGISKELAAVVRTSVLVSVSSGHQLLCTALSLAKSGRLPPSSKLSLFTFGSGTSATLPIAVATWPLPLTAGGDVLVVAACHCARDEVPESYSLQCFQLRIEDSNEAKLVLQAVLPIEGVDGELTAFDLLTLSATESSPVERCKVACGTARGCLAIFDLRWHLLTSPPFGEPSSELSKTPPQRPEATIQAHGGKQVSDVQWRRDDVDLDSNIAAAASAGKTSVDNIRAVPSLLLLTTGFDGTSNVWRLSLLDEASPQLSRLHTRSGPVLGVTSGPLLAACWDLSSGRGDEVAVLCGGRELVAFRWTASVHNGTGSEATGGQAPLPEPLEDTGSRKRRCVADHPKRIAPQATKLHPGVRVVAGESASRSSRGAVRQQQQQSASMLSLAMASLHQQTVETRAMEMVRLFPSVLELKPRKSSDDAWPSATLLSGPPPSLLTAILVNRQDYADYWLAAEISHRLENVANIGVEDVRSTGATKVRLLKLWSTDVSEAATLEVGNCDGFSTWSDGCGLPFAWLWTALSPAISDTSWRNALERLCTEPAGKGDSVHFAAAAALVLGRDDEAVCVYVKAELFADALLLSRIRFPARHPIVSYVYGQWAVDFKRRGSHELAMACFLAIGRHSQALAALDGWRPSTTPSALEGKEGKHRTVMSAGVFVVAALTEVVATAHLEHDRDLNFAVRNAGPEEGGEDLTLAFDHRRWWSKPALRAVVTAWRRFFAHALFDTCFIEALSIARVDYRRPLTNGELFVRVAMTGYASAIAWWVQLHQNSGLMTVDVGDTSADETETIGRNGKREEVPPLVRFVERGQTAAFVCATGDWDFEWRALTWLPAFDPHAEPILTAAVELGRACASLCSGSTRAESACDAPWDHVVNAVHAMLALCEESRSCFSRTLVCLGEMCQYPRDGVLERELPSSSSAWSRGVCVASFAALVAASIPAKKAVVLEDGTSEANSVVEGETDKLATAAASAGNHANGMTAKHTFMDWQAWACFGPALHGASFSLGATESRSEVIVSLLRRGYKLSRATAGSLSPGAIVRDAAEVVAGSRQNFSLKQVRGICCSIDHACWRAANSCELTGPRPAEPLSEDDLPRSLTERLRFLSRTCRSSHLVPLATVDWCSRTFLGRDDGFGLTADAELEETLNTMPVEEYESVGNDGQALAQIESVSMAVARARTLLVDVLKAVAICVEDELSATSDSSTDVGSPETNDSALEADVIKGLLQLESLPHLSFAVRLDVLRRHLTSCVDGEAINAICVACSLLGCLLAKPSAVSHRAASV